MALAIVGLPLSSGLLPAQVTPVDPPDRSKPVGMQRGATFLVVSVVDSGDRVERREREVHVRLERSAATQGMTEVLDFGFNEPQMVSAGKASVRAAPGYAIAGVRFGPTHEIGSVQTIIAGDRTSVEVTVEMTEATARKDAVELPLSLIEEKTTQVQLPPVTLKEESALFAFGSYSESKFQLPPAPSGLTNLKRRFDVELRVAEDGDRSILVASAPDVRLPWSIQIPRGTAALSFSLSAEPDHLRQVTGWWCH
jgi:hypothetical protein